MSNAVLTLPLLEFLSFKAGCMYLSDLPHIHGWGRVRAFWALKQVPPEAASLREWNDALDYLAHAPPERTAQEARARLIAALSRAQPKQTDTVIHKGTQQQEEETT